MALSLGPTQGQGKGRKRSGWTRVVQCVSGFRFVQSFPHLKRHWLGCCSNGEAGYRDDNVAATVGGDGERCGTTGRVHCLWHSLTSRTNRCQRVTTHYRVQTCHSLSSISRTRDLLTTDIIPPGRHMDWIHRAVMWCVPNETWIFMGRCSMPVLPLIAVGDTKRLKLLTLYKVSWCTIWKSIRSLSRIRFVITV